MNLKKFIDEVPNFPQRGVFFKSITPILKNHKAFQFCIKEMIDFAKEIKADKIIGIESRGFIFASVIAYTLNLPLVIIRKKGKLPKKCFSQAYSLEYGKAQLEIQKEDIKPRDKILIVDDVLATGGTMHAAAKLVKKAKAKIAGITLLIELKYLNGSSKLKDINTKSLIEY